MPRLPHPLLVRALRAIPPLAVITLAVALGLGPGPGSQAGAQSAILESVKQNPALAKALCQQWRQLNAQGVAATSPQAVSQVARQQNLSPMEAEVLTTYVIGLYCPDVR